MEMIKYGRKRSGIIDELNDVIGEWVLSIDNEELRQVVSNNVIVTGGSICSMLMGDSVNDYDIYFKTKEAAIRVAQYYMSKTFSTQCSVIDYRETDEPTKESNYVRVFKQEHRDGRIEERVECFISSTGFVSRETDEKYSVSYISSNAITLTDKVQIVLRFYGTPTEIHNNYDFVHAKCYFDYGEQNLHLDPRALECMMSRTLIYAGSLYPIASIFRMKKFIERGWRISAGQQLKIMWQISELNLTDMRVLKEQLTGVDMLYLHNIFEAVKEQKDNKIDIDSQYVSKLIDKIFKE